MTPAITNQSIQTKQGKRRGEQTQKQWDKQNVHNQQGEINTNIFKGME